MTLYDDMNNHLYTYLLENNENPQIEEFENRYHNFTDEVAIDIYNKIIENIGGKKAASRLGVTNYQGIGNPKDLTLDIGFFNNEIEMLRRMFRLMHALSPDFLLVWNMSFDIPYIIQRCYNLGADPAEIMCDPSFKYKEAYYFIDKKNENEPANRSDYAFISGKIVFKDQLELFAQTRKAKIRQFGGLKLNDIGEMIAHVKKYDYSDITTSVIKLPYLNYYRFVIYNMIDTVVQKCIEYKIKDVDALFMKALLSNTSYPKCNKQSIFLANKIAAEYFKDGYIMGNNVNKWNEKPTEKYAGALVGEPDNVDKTVLKQINGVPTMIVDNMADEDFKALYPSETMENNIASNTQIGYVKMDEKIYPNENATKDDKYSRSGEFFENLMCDNIVEFCKRYYNLSGFKEFITFDLPNAIASFMHFKNKKNNVPVKPVNHNGLVSPVRFNSINKSPVHFEKDTPDYQKNIQDIKGKIKG